MTRWWIVVGLLLSLGCGDSATDTCETCGTAAGGDGGGGMGGAGEGGAGGEGSGGGGGMMMAGEEPFISCFVPMAQVGTPWETSCGVFGSPTPEITYNGVDGPWPAWVMRDFDGTAVTLSGTPMAADEGQHGMEILATNDLGTSQFLGYVTVAP